MASPPEESPRPRAAAADALAAPPAAPPRPAAPPLTPDRIKPIIAEIRARMADLNQRELALRRREQEFQQRFRQATDPAGAGAAGERLRQRSAELDAQAVELAARADQLGQREQQVAEQQAELDLLRQQFREQLEALRRRQAADRQQRDEERRLLRQRIGTIRKRELELERRIGLARDDIVRQRDELDRARTELQTQVGELERRAHALVPQRAALEREAAQLQTRAVELAARESELAAVQAEYQNRELELRQAARELEHRRQQLDRQARELEQRGRTTSDERAALAGQLGELEAGRQTLQERQASLAGRSAQLDQREQEWRGRMAALQAEAQRLAEADAALLRRQAALDDLGRQVERARLELQQARDAVLAQREQADAREVDIRQAQLAVELEQQELAAGSAALARAQDELDQRRRQSAARTAQVQAALAADAEQLRRASRVLLGGARRWWLRGGVLAVLAGALAASTWWRFEPPAYRVTAELHPVSQLDAEPVLAEHARRLLTPGVVEQVLAEPALSQAWAAAQRAGHLRIAPAADPPRLLLVLTAAADGPARALLRRACEEYVQRMAAAPPGALLPEPDDGRDALAAEIAQRTALQRSLSEKIEGLAPLVVRDAARTELSQLRADYEESGRQLTEQRGRLADLLAQPPPRGEVLPADYAVALAGDEMFTEDRKEFRTSAVQYRSELAVAMLLLSDPPRDLRRVVGQFAQTLSEQRELRPPPAVAAVLEETSSTVAAFDARVTTFLEQWAALLDRVQNTEPEERVVELVQQQHAAADAIQQICREAGELVEGVRARLDQMAGVPEGGTRAVVVAAMLRGESAKLEEAVGMLLKAAESADVAHNFRLDALERQLRGLRTRLDQRQAGVRQQLQFAADDRARQAHAERVSGLQQAVTGLESRREALLERISAALDQLWRLDLEVLARQQAEADLARETSALTELHRQLERIDARRAERAATPPQGPDITAGPVQAVQIAGAARGRHAALAGGAAAALTFLLALLLSIRNPLRRAAPWEPALAGLGAAEELSGDATAGRGISAEGESASENAT